MRQRGRDGALLRAPSSASSSGNGRRTPSAKIPGRSAAKKKRRVDDGTSPAIAGKLKVEKEEKEEKEEEEEGGGEEEKLLRDQNSGEAGNKETVTEDKEDKEEKEEEEDKEEEDGEEGEEEEEEGEGGERVKLDEGFYEVEEIRGKRTRKGKSQYLVKWQGWPMSANTWEPIDNLIICKDLVDEFEKSSHAGKQGKRGRGKRKSNVVPRKKSHSSSFEVGSGDIEFGKDGEGQIDRQVLLDDAKQRSLLTAEVPNLVVSDRLGNKDSRELNTSSKEEGNGTEAATDNNGTYVRDVAMVEALGDDPLLLACDPHRGLIEEGAKSPPVSALVSLEEVPTDGVKAPSPFENNHLEQASPLSNKKAGIEELVKHASVDKCSGARKRKQGCVRRVPQSVDSEEPQEKRESNEEQIKEMQHVSPESKHAYNGGDSGSRGPQMLNETFGSQILVEETKACDFSAPVPELPEITTPPPVLITEIIKAVSYTNTTSNGKQNVTVGFKVLRSDGEEVMVDNKFLRAKFPMLLIDFYEQHLRYSV